MPLSEESIIAPAGIQFRAPLKKSTVLWAMGVLLFLAVVGVAAPALFRSGTDTPPPVTASSNTPKGQADQIDGEFMRARRQAAIESVNVPKPAPQAILPMPVALMASGQRSFLPDNARRDDNSGALYGEKVDEAGNGASIEQDAQARQSASVKADFADAPNEAALAAATAVDPVIARARAAVAEASIGAPDKSSADRLASLVDAARRGESNSIGTAAERSWLKEFGGATRASAPLRAYKVTNPYTLLQGKVLPAVLGRDLNSDLPGEVSACTTLDVYDSLSSRYLLIPKGSCLQGKYSNAIQMGQERILFAFTRLTMPNGLSVDLPGAPGADLSGAAGVSGDVNNHFIKMFSASLLIALLADKVEKGKQAPALSSGSGGGAVSAAGQVLVDVSKTVLERNRTIPPTITVSKGTRINVEVTRDIEFQEPYLR
jgi:type IV secretory pathway VirB10-like protein